MRLIGGWNKKMKAYFKFALLLATLITGALAVSAQDSPVLYDGAKVVTVSKGDKLGKHLKGDDKKAIRKLIIKDDKSNPYVSPYFCEDFVKVLSQLPNLETVDASGSESASWLLAYNDDVKIRDISVRRIIINDIHKRSEGFQINDIGYYLGEYLGKKERNDGLGRYVKYPNIEEFIIKNIGWNQNGVTNDSLFFNLNYNGFTPILLSRDNALSFKKTNSSNRPCQIIIGSCDLYDRDRRMTTSDGIEGLTPSNKDLKGAVICDNGFIDKLDVDTLVIPSSLQKIIRCSDKNYKGTANVVIFKEGTIPITIEYKSLDGLTINKGVVFNRPATVSYGFHDLDSLVFNKAAVISKDRNNSTSGLNNIKNLIFNNTATIDGHCGGYGHELIVFKGSSELEKEAFGNVGTIRFEMRPTLDKNYASAQTVYVPEGCKSYAINASPSSSKIYEIIHEKPANEMIAKTIELNSPRSLLSAVTPKELSKIDSLTVVGIMNNADAKALTELGTNISYLDLKDCIILNTEEESGVRYCIIPSNFMKGNAVLREVILPRTTIEIESYGVFSDCPRLKKVKFPPYLETIGYANFQNCPSLEEVVFPKSLRYIADNLNQEYACFANCPNIKKVIFNGSTLSDNISLFKSATSSLEEIWLPGYRTWSGGYDHAIGFHYNPLQNKKIYVPENVTSFTGKYSNCEFHFQSAKAPSSSDLTINNCTIYCPKGATTSYFSAFGKDNEYVESDFPKMTIEKDEYALRYINNQKQLERRLKETKARKADAEWRRKYGNNAEPCMQCYGTGILNRKVGNTYYPKFCPYCNGTGVIRKK